MPKSHSPGLLELSPEHFRFLGDIHQVVYPGGQVPPKFPFDAVNSEIRDYLTVMKMATTTGFQGKHLQCRLLINPELWTQFRPGVGTSSASRSTSRSATPDRVEYLHLDVSRSPRHLEAHVFPTHLQDV
jgi:hypothetical protein